MNKKEFAKMLTTKKGANVLDAIIVNGMKGLDNPLTEEKKIAKEIVDSYETPESVFLYIWESFAMARRLISPDGKVNCADLPWEKTE